MVHFADLVGTFSEVGGDLGHNLRSEVDSFIFAGLEEGWGLEVIGEKSSSFSKNGWYEFEFLSFLFVISSFFSSQGGGFVHNLL